MEQKNPLVKAKRKGKNGRVVATYPQPNVGRGKMGTAWYNNSCGKSAFARGVPEIVVESEKLIEKTKKLLEGSYPEDPNGKTFEDQRLYTSMRELVYKMKGSTMQEVIDAISKQLDVRIVNLNSELQNIFMKLYNQVNEKNESKLTESGEADLVLAVAYDYSKTLIWMITQSQADQIKQILTEDPSCGGSGLGGLKGWAKAKEILGDYLCATNNADRKTARKAERYEEENDYYLDISSPESIAECLLDW